MGFTNLFKKKSDNNLELHSIGDGIVKTLDECIDVVFAQKMVGDGYLFTPTTNELYSPVNGIVTVVMPTNHAIGIKTDDGLDILIHVGIESVTLEERHIFFNVNLNDRISINQKIADIDLDMLKKKLPSIDTPVLVTNLENRSIEIIKTGSVSSNDQIALIK